MSPRFTSKRFMTLLLPYVTSFCPHWLWAKEFQSITPHHISSCHVTPHHTASPIKLTLHHTKDNSNFKWHNLYFFTTAVWGIWHLAFGMEHRMCSSLTMNDSMSIWWIQYPDGQTDSIATYLVGGCNQFEMLLALNVFPQIVRQLGRPARICTVWLPITLDDSSRSSD